MGGLNADRPNTGRPAQANFTRITRSEPLQNGPTIMTNGRLAKSTKPFANRSNQWSSSIGRPDSRGSQSAQRSHERYLALAQAQAQSGNVIEAENYYQYAEHYFRSMSPDERSLHDDETDHKDVAREAVKKPGNGGRVF